MKPPRISPCCIRSSSHSLSRTSVLRPGTALTWAALASTTSTCGSSRLNTGFQYTPVDSIATWLTPCSTSHAPSRSRSGVIVPYVRVCWCRCPRSSTQPTVTTAVRLCTSMPAHRGDSTSIVTPPAGQSGRQGGAPTHAPLFSACSDGPDQDPAPGAQGAIFSRAHGTESRQPHTPAGPDSVPTLIFIRQGGPAAHGLFFPSPAEVAGDHPAHRRRAHPDVLGPLPFPAVLRQGGVRPCRQALGQGRREGLGLHRHRARHRLRGQAPRLAPLPQPSLNGRHRHGEGRRHVPARCPVRHRPHHTPPQIF